MAGFDLQTASTLYWKPIPVLLKQHDREDQVEQLTFRILSGVTRQNHNLRVGACFSAPRSAPARSASRAAAALRCAALRVCVLLSRPSI